MDNIKETQEICTKWSKILYINDPRYTELRSGSYSAAKIAGFNLTQGIDSFKVFMAEVILMSRSKKFVGTGSSGVWQLIYMLRGAKETGTLD